MNGRRAEQWHKPEPVSKQYQEQDVQMNIWPDRQKYQYTWASKTFLSNKIDTNKNFNFIQ